MTLYTAANARDATGSRGFTGSDRTFASLLRWGRTECMPGLAMRTRENLGLPAGLRKGWSWNGPG